MPLRGKVGQKFDLTFDPEIATFRVAFENWAKLVKDWRPAWKHIVTLFRKHERRHLETEGTQTGQKFGALSERPTYKRSYAAWKARHYPGLPILQRERVLFQALVEGGQGSINEPTKSSLVVGIKPGAVVPDPRTGKAYNLSKAAQAHARGATLRMPQGTTATLPARPPIRFDGNVQDESAFGYAVSQILQAHIVKARRRVFERDIEEALGGPAGAHASPDRTIAGVLSRGHWR